VLTVRRFDSRPVAPFVAYAACFAVIWGLIGLEPDLRVGEIAVALALQVLVGVVLVLLGRRNPRPWAALVGMVAFLASVVLLRDGVGATPGYGPLLLLPVIWAALRRRRGELGFAIAGAGVVLFTPIVAIGGTRYPPSGWRSGALLVVIAVVLGGYVLELVEKVERQRDDAKEMLASQHALRQLATLVATGAQPAAVFHAVAEQLANLFGGTLASVIRFDGPAGVGEIVGGCSADGAELTGQTIDLAGTSAAASVYRTGAPAQIVGYDERSSEQIVKQLALGGAVCAPILVCGSLWGSAGAAFAEGMTIPPGAEDRLARFAELVALAIANAQARETLVLQAATDPVTGLANHRKFHERLNSEVERASRHGRVLSLALFDLDHFKQINDTHGHQTGDTVLAEVAQRLAAVARTGEVVARIGGEEFAWLMPETTQEAAYLASERARRAIQKTPFQIAGPLTISAGVASNQHADSTDALFSAADRALYSAKHNGRNTTFIYTHDTPPHPAYTT
jgi:diguanylate cyclase (GGDEF)-like protein